jgi:Ion transport protein
VLPRPLTYDSTSSATVHFKLALQQSDTPVFCIGCPPAAHTFHFLSLPHKDELKGLSLSESGSETQSVPVHHMKHSNVFFAHSISPARGSSYGSKQTDIAFFAAFLPNDDLAPDIAMRQSPDFGHSLNLHKQEQLAADFVTMCNNPLEFHSIHLFAYDIRNHGDAINYCNFSPDGRFVHLEFGELTDLDKKTGCGHHRVYELAICGEAELSCRLKFRGEIAVGREWENSYSSYQTKFLSPGGTHLLTVTPGTYNGPYHPGISPEFEYVEIGKTQESDTKSTQESDAKSESESESESDSELEFGLYEVDVRPRIDGGVESTLITSFGPEFKDVVFTPAFHFSPDGSVVVIRCSRPKGSTFGTARRSNSVREYEAIYAVLNTTTRKVEHTIVHEHMHHAWNDTWAISADSSRLCIAGGTAVAVDELLKEGGDTDASVTRRSVGSLWIDAWDLKTGEQTGNHHITLPDRAFSPALGELCRRDDDYRCYADVTSSMSPCGSFVSVSYMDHADQIEAPELTDEERSENGLNKVPMWQNCVVYDTKSGKLVRSFVVQSQMNDYDSMSSIEMSVGGEYFVQNSKSFWKADSKGSSAHRIVVGKPVCGPSTASGFRVAMSHNGTYIVVCHAGDAIVYETQPHKDPQWSNVLDSPGLASVLKPVIACSTNELISHVAIGLVSLRRGAHGDNKQCMVAACHPARNPLRDTVSLFLLTGELVAQFVAHPGFAVQQVVFDPQGSYLVSLHDGFTNVWSIAGMIRTAHRASQITVTRKRTISSAHNMSAVCLSPDGTLMAARCDSIQSVCIFSVTTGHIMKTIVIPPNPALKGADSNDDELSFEASSFDFSPDGRFVLCGSVVLVVGIDLEDSRLQKLNSGVVCDVEVLDANDPMSSVALCLPGGGCFVSNEAILSGGCVYSLHTGEVLGRIIMPYSHRGQRFSHRAKPRPIYGNAAGCYAFSYSLTSWVVWNIRCILDAGFMTIQEGPQSFAGKIDIDPSGTLVALNGMRNTPPTSLYDAPGEYHGVGIYSTSSGERLATLNTRGNRGGIHGAVVIPLAGGEVLLATKCARASCALRLPLVSHSSTSPAGFHIEAPVIQMLAPEIHSAADYTRHALLAIRRDHLYVTRGEDDSNTVTVFVYGIITGADTPNDALSLSPMRSINIDLDDNMSGIHCLSDDAQWLVCATGEGRHQEIKIFSMHTGQFVSEIVNPVRKNAEVINVLAIPVCNKSTSHSAHHQLVALAYKDSGMDIVDLNQPDCPVVYQLSGGDAVACSLDGKVLVSMEAAKSRQTVLHIYDLSSTTWHVDSSDPSSVTEDAKGTESTVTLDSKTNIGHSPVLPSVHDIDLSAVLEAFPEILWRGDSYYCQVALSPSGRHIFIACSLDSGLVTLLRLGTASGELESATTVTLAHAGNTQLEHLSAFHIASGQRDSVSTVLLIGGEGLDIFVDASSGRIVGTVHDGRLQTSDIQQIAFLPNSTHIAMCSDKACSIRNTQTLLQSSPIEISPAKSSRGLSFKRSHSCLSVSPDGARIVLSLHGCCDVYSTLTGCRLLCLCHGHVMWDETESDAKSLEFRDSFMSFVLQSQIESRESNTAGDVACITSIDWEIPVSGVVSPASGVVSVAYSPNGTYIASMSAEQIVLHDAVDGHTVDTFSVTCYENFRHGDGCLAFSPDGTRIATSFGLVLEVESGLALHSAIADIENPYHRMSPIVAFSPCGERVLFSTDRVSDGIGGLLVVNSSTGIRERLIHHREFSECTNPTNNLSGAKFSPTGEYIIATTYDDHGARTAVRVFNAHTGAPYRRWRRPSGLLHDYMQLPALERWAQHSQLLQLLKLFPSSTCSYRTFFHAVKIGDAAAVQLCLATPWLSPLWTPPVGFAVHGQTCHALFLALAHKHGRVVSALVDYLCEGHYGPKELSAISSVFDANAARSKHAKPTPQKSLMLSSFELLADDYPHLLIQLLQRVGLRPITSITSNSAYGRDDTFLVPLNALPSASGTATCAFRGNIHDADMKTRVSPIHPSSLWNEFVKPLIVTNDDTDDVDADVDSKHGSDDGIGGSVDISNSIVTVRCQHLIAGIPLCGYERVAVVPPEHPSLPVYRGKSGPTGAHDVVDDSDWKPGNFQQRYTALHKKIVHGRRRMYRKHNALQVLRDSGEPVQAAFGTRLIQTLIDYKWEQFGRRMFLQRMVMYMMYLLCFCIASLGFEDESYAELDTVNWTKRTWIRAVLELIVVLFSAHYFYLEVQQFRREHSWRAYAADVWNWLDISSCMLIFVLVPASIWEWPQRRALQGIVAVLLWLKLLHFLRAFFVTGPFIRMVLAILNGIMPFMLILVVVMIAFSHGLSMLFVDSDDPDLVFEYSSWNGLLKAYQLLLGDFDVSELRRAEYTVVALVFFIVFTLFGLILLLNLLIALMSSIYERVQSNVLEEWYAERADLILELEQSMSVFQRQGEAGRRNFPAHIHVLQPAAILHSNTAPGDSGVATTTAVQHAAKVSQQLQLHSSDGVDSSKLDLIVRDLATLNATIQGLQEQIRMLSENR